VRVERVDLIEVVEDGVRRMGNGDVREEVVVGREGGGVEAIEGRERVGVEEGEEVTRGVVPMVLAGHLLSAVQHRATVQVPKLYKCRVGY